jgi:hypothetical protein
MKTQVSVTRVTSARVGEPAYSRRLYVAAMSKSPRPSRVTGGSTSQSPLRAATSSQGWGQSWGQGWGQG